MNADEDELVSVRVALWDVRAQWESGLRTLTVAQSYLDRWADVSADDQRQVLLTLLQGQVDALQAVNTAVHTLLGGIDKSLARDFGKVE